MSQQESDGASVVPSADPWKRERRFSDGRAPIGEWLCSDCRIWYPDRIWHVIEFRKGNHPEPFCYSCRPPKSAAMRHLQEGGSVLFSYGGFTEWIKKNAAERARGGHGQ